MASIGNADYVGIMAQESKGNPPFGEKQYYARLCKLGRALGLTVYVFSPLQVNPIERSVRGYTLQSATDIWEERMFPLPDLIYDRSFFVSQNDYIRHRAAVRRLQQLKPIPYLGHGLKSKWEVLVYLRRDPALRPYLPKTLKLVHHEQVAVWLSVSNRVFLKPLSGSQGKGTAMVERTQEGYRVCARDTANQPLERTFSATGELNAWIRAFTGKRSYLIQQYLELHSAENTAWDVRSLVQKNGNGLWVLTGMAVRQGDAGSITSNLHGGGTALEVPAFLERQYGIDKAAAILTELHSLSEQIPPVLEASNGRMAELGIDLGVDRDGRVWIIEVNTKPGRSVFHQLQQERESYHAARNPMAYARHLLRRSDRKVYPVP